MTFEAALERANQRDQQLSAMEDNAILLERDQRAVDRRANNLSVGPNYLWSLDYVIGWGSNFLTMQRADALSDRVQMENQIRRLDINRRLLREANEMTLLGILADIELARLDIIMLEGLLNFEQRQLELTEVLYSLGMADEASLRVARNDVAQTRLNLEAAKLSEDGHRLALNNFLGLAVTANVEITNLVWDQADPVEADVHIRNIQRTSPAIMLARIDFDEAVLIQYIYDVLLSSSHRAPYYIRNYYPFEHFSWQEDSTPVILLRNQVYSAQRAMHQELSNTAHQIRNLYNSLAQMQYTRDTAGINLYNARADYQNLQIHYTVGMVARAQLEAAEMAILSHEIQLARLEINYGMLMQLYARPHFAR